MHDLLNKEKYFVHRGTWKNNYEWRIQKVLITGVKIDNEDKELHAEFSFASTGYDYPVSHLKDTLLEAKKFAIERINNEAKRLIDNIKNKEVK